MNSYWTGSFRRCSGSGRIHIPAGGYVPSQILNFFLGSRISDTHLPPIPHSDHSARQVLTRAVPSSSSIKSPRHNGNFGVNFTIPNPEELE
ncbi:uncharacterized protein J3R85_002013 [Psidium guajava]|nr:uncharacterized protein J3R85_002013 [Psidium guajava]